MSLSDQEPCITAFSPRRQDAADSRTHSAEGSATSSHTTTQGNCPFQNIQLSAITGTFPSFCWVTPWLPRATATKCFCLRVVQSHVPPAAAGRLGLPRKAELIRRTGDIQGKHRNKQAEWPFQGTRGSNHQCVQTPQDCSAVKSTFQIHLQDIT